MSRLARVCIGEVAIYSEIGLILIVAISVADRVEGPVAWLIFGGSVLLSFALARLIELALRSSVDADISSTHSLGSAASRSNGGWAERYFRPVFFRSVKTMNKLHGFVKIASAVSAVIGVMLAELYGFAYAILSFAVLISLTIVIASTWWIYINYRLDTDR